MIIEQINGMTVIYAEGDNKLTNKDRTFFANMIYLSVNDSIENYFEVSKDIWRNYIEPEQAPLESINVYIENLEEVALDTDYRLMVLEMEKEYGEV